MSNFLYVYKEVIGMLEAKKNGRRLKKNIFWYNYATWRFKKMAAQKQTYIFKPLLINNENNNIS